MVAAVLGAVVVEAVYFEQIAVVERPAASVVDAVTFPALALQIVAGVVVAVVDLG